MPKYDSLEGLRALAAATGDANLALGVRVVRLPHAGGDPNLSALRAERSAGVRIRLLNSTERTVKPACTVEVGGQRFEIVDFHTGRKARMHRIAVDILERDLPEDGWVDTPADLDALDAEADAFEAFVEAVNLRLLGTEDTVDAVMSSFMSPGGPNLFAMERADAVAEEGRIALRDEYARKVSSL